MISRYAVVEHFQRENGLEPFLFEIAYIMMCSVTKKTSTQADIRYAVVEHFQRENAL